MLRIFLLLPSFDLPESWLHKLSKHSIVVRLGVSCPFSGIATLVLWFPVLTRVPPVNCCIANDYVYEYLDEHLKVRATMVAIDEIVSETSVLFSPPSEKFVHKLDYVHRGYSSLLSPLQELR